MSDNEDDRQTRSVWRAFVPLVLGLVVVTAGWAVFTSPDLSAGVGGGGGEAAATTTAPPEGPTEGGAALGEAIYGGTCVACHGPGAVGIEGLGKPLVDNEFVQSLTDEELLAFIKQGRLAGDPENTTGVAMPPKGGNPALSDQDLLDVVAYLRTLN